MDEPVVLTGAGGRVGTAILEGIGEEYDWRLFYHSHPEDVLVDGEVIVGDVTEEEKVQELVDGAGAVIHLAGDPRPEAPWDSVLDNNIHGTKVIMDAAAEAGVEKFAYASSNHAVGAFETDERTPEMYRSEDEFRLDGSEFPRPSNLYGVSKATGEVLGRYYYDHSDMDVISVRIGNLTRGHPPKEYERGQAMWLSYRDCAQLFDRCLQADYEHAIVYGISDNERKYYSLESAREVLGYDPQDDSAEFTFEGEPKESS